MDSGICDVIKDFISSRNNYSNNLAIFLQFLEMCSKKINLERESYYNKILLFYNIYNYF